MRKCMVKKKKFHEATTVNINKSEVDGTKHNYLTIMMFEPFVYPKVGFSRHLSIVEY